MNESEARDLALRIERFWHTRGYAIIRAFPILVRPANDNQKSGWIVRSNLTGLERCELIALRPVNLRLVGRKAA